MHRRHFLAGGSGLILAGGHALAQPVDPAAVMAEVSPGVGPFAGGVLNLETAAGIGWLYGIMLIENANARANTLRTVAPNTLVHARALTSVKTQSVTTPNNDTLYSRAWIDLGGGPVTLEMPKVGSRYISYAFMDMYGNNFAILGTRTTGGEARRVTIIGPGQTSNDPDAVRSPTPWTWLLIRTLVDGDADLRAANAVQDGMKLTGPQRPVPAPYATRDAPWDQYFTSVQRLIVENPPPPGDADFFRQVASLGLDRTGGFNPAKHTGGDAAAVAEGVKNARSAATDARGNATIRGGWSYPQRSLGNFGQEYLFRARTAISGLAALPPVEAMYMRPFLSGQDALDSSKPWILKFARAELPPVNAFWSLTSYEKTPAGQFYFFNNPINRYAIGDRTPGLAYGADGSLEIYMSRTRPPAGPRRANWLPSPPQGPLSLVFRAYLPKPELLEGRYSLPAIVAA